MENTTMTAVAQAKLLAEQCSKKIPSTAISEQGARMKTRSSASTYEREVKSEHMNMRSSASTYERVSPST